MKRIYILFAVIAVISTSDAQTTTTDAQNTSTGAEEVTDGSGGGEDVSTPGVINPCLDDPCANGGSCIADSSANGYYCQCSTAYTGDKCQTRNPCLDYPCANGGSCIADSSTNGYSCQCSTGYTGDKCETAITCEEKTLVINASDVNYNEDCGSSTPNSSNDTTTLTLQFTTTASGSWAASPLLCQSSCVDQNGVVMLPLATVECTEKGEFSEPVYTDCSAEEDSLTNEQRLTYSIAVTANPATTGSQDVIFAVDNTAQFLETQGTLTQPDASSAMDVYNNLLAATDTDATDEVKQQSDQIFNSLDVLSENVVLASTLRATDGDYTSVDENIAIAVTNSYATGGVCLVAADLSNMANLKAAGLRISRDFPCQGTYIESTNRGSERVSFRVYRSSVTLFEKISNVNVQSTVLSAYGNGSFIFNFENSRGQLSQGKCRRWSNSTREWVEASSDCARDTSETTVKCSCSREGDYIITTDIDSGLSTGAIVGIVIGCVVGVALIGGGVFYFASYAKKKKRKNAVTALHDEVKLEDAHDDD